MNRPVLVVLVSDSTNGRTTLLAVIDTVEDGSTVAGVSYDGMQYFNATMDCNFRKEILRQANRVGFWAFVAPQVRDVEPETRA